MCKQIVKLAFSVSLKHRIGSSIPKPSVPHFNSTWKLNSHVRIERHQRLERPADLVR